MFASKRFITPGRLFGASQRRISSWTNQSSPNRILVVGCLGQIGSELVPALMNKYGSDRVVGADLRRPSAMSRLKEGRWFRYVDVTNISLLHKLIVEEQADWIIHNASILSATGELNPTAALRINIDGLNNVLEAARINSTQDNPIRVFVPSSISAFGKTTPQEQTPNETIQRPNTIYGISKVYSEMLGEYYSTKFGIDFRCLRYPGIISSETTPGGGTTDWAVDIFIQAVRHGRYDDCYLNPESTLPMMYMPDCLDATLGVLDYDDATDWPTRVFNVTAMSLHPEQLAEEIRKFIPNFEITYKVDPLRQAIADSWPRSLDDSVARESWGWSPKWSMEKMTRDMLMAVKRQMDAKGIPCVPFEGI